jgi:hypothetical protein
LRSLAQVLLGMFCFVLVVELITALGADGGVVIVGGAAVGVPALLFALIAGVAALVAVSMLGRPADYTPPPATIRCECAQCDWATMALTREEARSLGQQHLRDAHSAT